MTDAAPPTHTDKLGVVDPIRVPGVVRAPMARAGDAYRRLPVLGQVFVVLAIVDIVLRAVGFAGMSLYIDVGYPLSFVTAFLPDTLMILLPAILLARRPDAASATPLILRGAIVLALVELLKDPISGLAVGLPDGSGFVASASVGVARTLLSAVGWVAVALGLAAITTGRPAPAAMGLANLVLVAAVASAVTQLGLLLFFTPPDLGEPAWNTASMLNNAMFPIEAAALAYLAWVVIRGTNDERRPVAARYLATSAFVVSGVLAAVVAIVGAVILVQAVFAIPRGLGYGEVALAWIGGWPVITAVLIAFALGLADNSVRIPGSGGFAQASGPEPDPVRWPTPGGDVPTYHPVQAPPSPEPTKTSRRRKSKER